MATLGETLQLYNYWCSMSYMAYLKNDDYHFFLFFLEPVASDTINAGFADEIGLFLKAEARLSSSSSSWVERSCSSSEVLVSLRPPLELKPGLPPLSFALSLSSTWLVAWLACEWGRYLAPSPNLQFIHATKKNRVLGSYKELQTHKSKIHQEDRHK